MKELSLEELSVLDGKGTSLECGLATVGLIAAYGGLFVATGGIGLAFAAAGAIVAPTSFGLSCFGGSEKAERGFTSS